MTYRVFLFAFKGDGQVRNVTVPDEILRQAGAHDFAEIADVVFKYGQNDFQPLPMRSVSVDDIIEIENESEARPFRYFRVDDFGFTEVTNTFTKWLRERGIEDAWIAQENAKAGREVYSRG